MKKHQTFEPALIEALATSFDPSVIRVVNATIHGPTEVQLIFDGAIGTEIRIRRNNDGGYSVFAEDGLGWQPRATVTMVLEHVKTYLAYRGDVFRVKSRGYLGPLERLEQFQAKAEE